jgi:hypothetical protein
MEWNAGKKTYFKYCSIYLLNSAHSVTHLPFATPRSRSMAIQNRNGEDISLVVFLMNTFTSPTLRIKTKVLKKMLHFKRKDPNKEKSRRETEFNRELNSLSLPFFIRICRLSALFHHPSISFCTHSTKILVCILQEHELWHWQGS